MADFVFNGELRNGDKVKGMINRSPKVFTRYLKAAMLREGTAFIGSKKRDGTFRKMLLSKKTLAGKTWKLNVVRLFKILFEKPNQNLFDMKLRMGVLYHNQKQIHKAMEFLGVGGSISSSKYMPIPIYENLKRIGVTKPSKYFQNKMNKGTFRVVYKGGKAYYLDDKSNLSREGDRDKNSLLFVGIKKVQIHQQFDFEGAWENEKTNANSKLTDAVQKATSAVEKENGD